MDDDPTRYIVMPIQGTRPARVPKMNGVQLTLSLFWLYISISIPNRFMQAFTENMAIRLTMS